MEIEHPLIRDLRWVMSSPSLLIPTGRVPAVTDEECAELAREGEPALLKLASDPREILEYVETRQRDHRLGSHFETLVSFWFERLLKYPRVESGFVVREGGTTHGELDLIFRRPGTERFIHWEIAVKFYLCIRTREGELPVPSALVGPMVEDRLDVKLARALDSQLRLPAHPCARELLARAGIDIGESRLFMKGGNFYPVSWDWRRQPGPRECSMLHPRGWWTTFESGQLELPPDHTGRWIVLRGKKEWLAPAIATEKQLLSTEAMREELGKLFAERGPAHHISEMERRSDGLWAERSRGFILPAGWPGLPG